MNTKENGKERLVIKCLIWPLRLCCNKVEKYIWERTRRRSKKDVKEILNRFLLQFLVEIPEKSFTKKGGCGSGKQGLTRQESFPVANPVGSS